MQTENAPKQELKKINDEFQKEFNMALSANIDFDEFKHVFQHLKELRDKIVDLKRFVPA